MMPAYNLTLMLSITILTWLVVGVTLILFSSLRTNIILLHIISLLLSLFIFSIIELLIYKDIYVIVITTVISGFAEVACKYVINKNKLVLLINNIEITFVEE
jgi:hypothetical protein